MTLRITPAGLADRRVLSELSIIANLDNPYGQLVWRGTSTEERIQGSYARLPMKMLAEGSWMMKLEEDSKVIASAEWSLPAKLCSRLRSTHPLSASDEEQARYQKEYDQTVDENDWPRGMRLDVPLAVSPAMREGRKFFPQDREYIFLEQLKTLPEHRRRGAGSALLQWGLDLADQEGLEICLEAMPDGMGLYTRNGFEKLHEVSVDLSKYGGDGTFTWVFMIRKPRTRNL